VSYVHVPKISYPEEVWNIEKKSFSTRGYDEIHIQRPVFDNQKDKKKFLD
jgi:hypothetical protein